MRHKAVKWISIIRQQRNEAVAMKLIFRFITILATSVALIWANQEDELKNISRQIYLTNSTLQYYQQQHQQQLQQQQQLGQPTRLISFDSVGKNIALGLDYLLPFVEIPIKRKRNAPAKPLVIVNTAAMLSCGMVAVGGIFVSQLIRSTGLEVIEDDTNVTTTTTTMNNNLQARHLLDGEQRFLQLFNNFKLVYHNNSGERVDTTLPTLFDTIERTFLENDINLAVCLLKSICTLTRQANENVRIGQASDLERLLNGAIHWSWLLSWIEQTTLYDAITAGRVDASQYCTAKYPGCKWALPREQLFQLMSTNIQFK